MFKMRRSFLATATLAALLPLSAMAGSLAAPVATVCAVDGDEMYTVNWEMQSPSAPRYVAEFTASYLLEDDSVVEKSFSFTVNGSATSAQGLVPDMIDFDESEEGENWGELTGDVTAKVKGLHAPGKRAPKDSNNHPFSEPVTCGVDG